MGNERMFEVDTSTFAMIEELFRYLNRAEKHIAEGMWSYAENQLDHCQTLCAYLSGPGHITGYYNRRWRHYQKMVSDLQEKVRAINTLVSNKTREEIVALYVEEMLGFDI